MHATHRGLQQRLLDVPVFQTLPEDLRLSFCMTLWWLGEVREMKYGEILFRQGDAGANTGCALLDGIVSVRRDNHPPIEVSGPDLLGELMQLENDAIRTATVTVAERALVLQFDWHDFVGVCGLVLDQQKQDMLRERMQEIGAQRLREIKDEA
jgi:CRP-like cAMP-binding protein